MHRRELCELIQLVKEVFWIPQTTVEQIKIKKWLLQKKQLSGTAFESKAFTFPLIKAYELTIYSIKIETNVKKFSSNSCQVLTLNHNKREIEQEKTIY